MNEPAEEQKGEINYFIDFTRFGKENRSLTTIIRSRLCPTCQQQRGTKLEGEMPDTLLLMVKNCCSKLPGFITPKMPVSEKLFRIFLASGSPLTVTELMARLGACSGSSFSLSEAALRRLLDNDQYYNFCQCLVPDFKGDEAASVG